MSTRVRVAVRSRPLVPKEKDDGCDTCITVIDDTQVLLGKVLLVYIARLVTFHCCLINLNAALVFLQDKCFTYDYVFGGETNQDDIFHSCAYPLIEAIFKGG